MNPSEAAGHQQSAHTAIVKVVGLAVALRHLPKQCSRCMIVKVGPHCRLVGQPRLLVSLAGHPGTGQNTRVDAGVLV